MKQPALTLAALAAACMAAPLLAQAGQMGPSLAASGVLEPDAAAALDRMGAYLRSLKAYEVVSVASADTVFGNGQKLQFQQRTTYTVNMPDKLAVDIRTDRQHRRVYYDGKTFTIHAPRAGLYTQFAVSGSIADVLGRAYENWGVEFPLQDLFRWGDPSSTVAKPTQGMRIGTVQLGAHQTGHYAFRQPGVDFQIWIDEGDKPLPRRMVITNTEDAAQPQFTADFSWTMAPAVTARTFTFTPGPNDRAIDLKSAAAAAAR